jgi:hypothetical protein
LHSARGALHASCKLLLLPPRLLTQVPEAMPTEGGELMSGSNPDLGPWALHWQPVKLRGKKKARLHHLGAKLQAASQLTELPRYLNMATQVQMAPAAPDACVHNLSCTARTLPAGAPQNSACARV